MAKTSYALALGSNRPHGRFGAPAAVVEAAVRVLESEGLDVGPVSAIRATPALGPAGMRSDWMMTLALRWMGNLVTDDDRDRAARVWRWAGRRSLARDQRPPFS